MTEGERIFREAMVRRINERREAEQVQRLLERRDTQDMVTHWLRPGSGVELEPGQRRRVPYATCDCLPGGGYPHIKALSTRCLGRAR